MRLRDGWKKCIGRCPVECVESRTRLSGLGLCAPESTTDHVGAVDAISTLGYRSQVASTPYDRLGSVRISAPSSVMAMVCSVWAVRQPVALRRVQPSASMTSSSVSAMTHGSSARSTPGRSS